MLKNLTLYRFTTPTPLDAQQVESALQNRPFISCGASEEASHGWIEPRGQANGPLLECVNSHWIMQLKNETKKVPGSVVKDKLGERLAKIKESEGRKPGKKEKLELRDEIVQALLPNAFPKRAATFVWIDPKTSLLVIDTASPAKADVIATALIEAIPDLSMTLIQTQQSPAACMSHWLSTNEAPNEFSIDQECELKACDESKAVVRYTRHALDTEEVSQHIAAGKIPTRVAMTWNDRVSFVMTDMMQVRKVTLLDVVLDGASKTPGDRKDDNFDANVVLATGELVPLIAAMLEALGGQVV